MFVEDGVERVRLYVKDGKEHQICTDEEGMALLLNDGYELIEELQEVQRSQEAPRPIGSNEGLGAIDDNNG